MEVHWVWRPFEGPPHTQCRNGPFWEDQAQQTQHPGALLLLALAWAKEAVRASHVKAGP